MKRSLGHLVAALTALSALSAGCASNSRVLVIGVDGLRPDQLIEADTPAIDTLIKRGTLSVQATNSWTPKDAWNGHSATNWGVLLTGVSPRTSDLTHNGDSEHLVDDDGDGPGLVRTIFGHLKADRADAQTACFNTWGGIGMEPGTILTAARGTVDMHFSGRSGETSAENDVGTVQAAVEALSGTGRFAGADVDLAFIHISQVDSAGHSFTYEDPRYRAAIEQVDELVGRLMTALDSRPDRMTERWLVLLTTDHGGPAEALNHADNGDPQVRTIPFLMAADGIRLDDVDLDGASLYDVAPTVLDWLGIEAPAEAMEGRSRLPW